MFTGVTNALHVRNGGLIGLAGTAIALGVDIAPYMDKFLDPLLSCFTDPENRVRYFSAECLYNIAKVSKGEVLVYFNPIFDALSKVSLSISWCLCCLEYSCVAQSFHAPVWRSLIGPVSNQLWLCRTTVDGYGTTFFNRTRKLMRPRYATPLLRKSRIICDALTKNCMYVPQRTASATPHYPGIDVHTVVHERNW